MQSTHRALSREPSFLESACLTFSDVALYKHYSNNMNMVCVSQIYFNRDRACDTSSIIYRISMKRRRRMIRIIDIYRRTCQCMTPRRLYACRSSGLPWNAGKSGMTTMTRKFCFIAWALKIRATIACAIRFCKLVSPSKPDTKNWFYPIVYSKEEVASS